MATIEIRITKNDGEVDQGIFYQARKDLARYWRNNPMVLKVEVRVLSEKSYACKEEWNLDASWEVVDQ